MSKACDFLLDHLDDLIAAIDAHGIKEGYESRPELHSIPFNNFKAIAPTMVATAKFVTNRIQGVTNANTIPSNNPSDAVTTVSNAVPKLDTVVSNVDTCVSNGSACNPGHGSLPCLTALARNGTGGHKRGQGMASLPWCRL